MVTVDGLWAPNRKRLVAAVSELPMSTAARAGGLAALKTGEGIWCLERAMTGCEKEFGRVSRIVIYGIRMKLLP